MRAAALLLTLACLSQPAQAQNVTIGATTIRLTPPIGHCVLSDAHPSDERALSASRTAIPPGNRLLAMTANCRQLEDWRGGRLPLLQDTAQFQALRDGPDVSSDPAGAVREVCKVLRAQGGEMTARVTGDANERLKNAAVTVKLNETRFLGVLAEDAQACHAGAVLKVRAERGNEITRVNLFAVTVVRGRMIFYYLAAPYAQGQSLDDMLVRHKANVAALRAAN